MIIRDLRAINNTISKACAVLGIIILYLFIQIQKLTKNIRTFDNNQRYRYEFTLHFSLYHCQFIQGRFLNIFLSDVQINLDS